MGLISIVAIAVTLGGAVVVLLGYKGRRIGDHPHCRRCDFDLFGLTAGTERCPECGALLSSRRSTAIGQRRRRPVMIVVGSIVTCLALGVAGVIFWGNHKQIDWQQYKPVVWLLHDARGTNAVAQKAALQELLRRQSANLLSAEHVKSIVDAGLVEQGNPDKPWIGLWGDFIHQAQIAQQVSEAQWKKYAEQAVRIQWLKVGMRPKLHAGDRVNLRLSADGARLGSRSSFYAGLGDPVVIIDGDSSSAVTLKRKSGLTATAAGYRAFGIGEFRELSKAIERLPIGKHSAKMKFQVRVTSDPSKYLPRPTAMPATPPMPKADDHDAMAKWIEARRQATEKYRQQMVAMTDARRKAMDAVLNGTAGPTFAEFELSVPFTFELVAPNQSPFTPITDESLRPQVEAALNIKELRLLGSMMYLEFTSQKPPVPMSFKVFVRQGTNMWAMDTPLVLHEDRRYPRVPNRLLGRASMENRPEGTTVDVVLRPDPEAGAASGAEIDRHWAREIIIKDVPVNDPTGAPYRAFPRMPPNPM